MKRIPWWRINFGDEEIERLGQSVRDEHVSMGPVTAEFEQQLATRLNVPHVVSTTSGSTALLVALMAFGIGQGDEVIMPDRTWIATAHAVLMLGAKVVLVDVRPDQPTIDLSEIESKINSRTKAILPVHLNGRDSGMSDIKNLARKHNLIVIEDAAQAIFSKTSVGYLGTDSDAGCFSLAVTKLISTSQGGFVAVRNQETYEKLKLVRNHGVVDNFTDTWNQMGFNFKFTDILASLGLVQLTKTFDRINHVTEIYRKYRDAISELENPTLKMIPVDIENGEVPVWAEIVSSKRHELMDYLAANNIQARPFAPSLHTSDYLENFGEFPNSDMYSENGMFLPCGPDQPIENIDRVIKVIQQFDRETSH